MTAPFSGFAVMADERPVLREVPAPAAFRFSDPNPLTSGSYAESVFRDLPAFVGAVVGDRLGLCAGEWDVLVEDREVYDFVGPNEVFRTGVGQTCTCGGSGLVEWVVRCPACAGSGVLPAGIDMGSAEAAVLRARFATVVPSSGRSA